MTERVKATSSLCLPAFLLHSSKPDVTVKSSWTTHHRSIITGRQKQHSSSICPLALSRLSHKGSAQQPVTCVWSGWSVCHHHQHCRLAAADWWAAKVIYLSLSSRIHHTDTCMHARSQKHTAHIDLQHTAEGIPFIKDLQAALCLFVCICDYGLAALRSPLSCLIRSANIKIQFYVLLYLELSWKNKNQVQPLLIQDLQRESSPWRFYASFIRERPLSAS